MLNHVFVQLIGEFGFTLTGSNHPCIELDHIFGVTGATSELLGQVSNSFDHVEVAFFNITNDVGVHCAPAVFNLLNKVAKFGEAFLVDSSHGVGIKQAVQEATDDLGTLHIEGSLFNRGNKSLGKGSIVNFKAGPGKVGKGNVLASHSIVLILAEFISVHEVGLDCFIRENLALNGALQTLVVLSNHDLGFFFGRHQARLLKSKACENGVDHAASTLQPELVISLPEFHECEGEVHIIHNTLVKAVLLSLKSQLLDIGLPAAVHELVLLVTEVTEISLLSDGFVGEKFLHKLSNMG